MVGFGVSVPAVCAANVIQELVDGLLVSDNHWRKILLAHLVSQTPLWGMALKPRKWPLTCVGLTGFEPATT
jgi:hypothetical protein